jgi:hypothetical protein
MNANVAATLADMKAHCMKVIDRADKALTALPDYPRYVIVSELWNRRIVYVNGSRYALGPQVAVNPYSFASERKALRERDSFMAMLAENGKPERLDVVTLRSWWLAEVCDASATLEMCEKKLSEIACN